MNYNLLVSTNPQIINLFSNLVLLNHEVEDEITEYEMEKISNFFSILNSSSWKKTTMICYFLLIQLNLWLQKSLIQALFWLDLIIIGWMMIFMAIDFWFFSPNKFRGLTTMRFLRIHINERWNKFSSRILIRSDVILSTSLTFELERFRVMLFKLEINKIQEFWWNFQEF